MTIPDSVNLIALLLKASVSAFVCAKRMILCQPTATADNSRESLRSFVDTFTDLRIRITPRNSTTHGKASLMRPTLLRTLMLGATILAASSAPAAVPQYITVNNTLQVGTDAARNPTQSPIAVHFFNDLPYACFSAVLNFNDTVSLSTGGARSPCETPVQSVTVTPLATLYHDVCFGPTQPLALDATAKVLNISFAPLVGPVFDTATGAVRQLGTVTVAVKGS